MKYRPRLTERENDIIQKDRALQKECKAMGIPMKDVDHYWHKGKHFSLHVKNKGVSPEELRDDIIKAMDKHSPSYKKIKRTKSENGHLLVIDPADIHIGKLATSFETGVDILETLISVADVHFVYNPSNHDYMSGFMLSDSIQSWFRKCKNITFDCSIAHRKGFMYGQNLIGTTHGDGAKLADLPLIMANEFSKEWAETKHRYVYTHHIHHKSSKDYHGITVESLRSPSGTDSWHHRNGYGVGGVKAVEGFIHSKEHGQVARLTHIF